MLPLTEKQQNICNLVIEGWTSQQIADKLGLSVRTIETHRENIYKKMGVKNTLELVRKVMAPAQ